jgi:hypothetical protein
MIALSPASCDEQECDVEGCSETAVYLFSFSSLSRFFCESCLSRRATDLLLFD